MKISKLSPTVEIKRVALDNEYGQVLPFLVLRCNMAFNERVLRERSQQEREELLRFVFSTYQTEAQYEIELALERPCSPYYTELLKGTSPTEDVGGRAQEYVFDA